MMGGGMMGGRRHDGRLADDGWMMGGMGDEWRHDGRP